MGKIFSIIIPCFNESNYIEKCINSALNQSIDPDEIEILVVDGMSNDGTREIISHISKKHPDVHLVDNPRKKTPFALNIGIEKATGEYIVIWGAHSEYSKDFLKNSLLLMNSHPEVSCVGGPITSEGNSIFGKAAAVAMSSTIGVGNAKHRFPDYEGYAEMACFPVFRRQVFERVGMYDEGLIRNQDDEFCFRLRLNNEKIFISPKVSSIYYTRSTPFSLFRQYFEYGYWRIAVLKKHKIPISYRQQVPAVFFSIIIVLIAVGIILENYLIGLIIPILYFTFLIIFGLLHLSKLGLRISARIPIAVFLIHLAYAAGFVKGTFKFLSGPYFERVRKD